jgi:hypothetical protein
LLREKTFTPLSVNADNARNSGQKQEFPKILQIQQLPPPLRRPCGRLPVCEATPTIGPTAFRQVFA